MQLTRRLLVIMPALATQRNIEIKAKILDAAAFQEKVEIAKKLTGSDGEKIVQHDVFFKVPNGRLKLRYEGNGAKLVQYSRDNVAGPKLSKFNIMEVPDGKGPNLEQILNDSLGTLGALDKTRFLFMTRDNKTRIHLDIVKNNNQDFFGMEFEVMMKPEEDLELGNKIADELTAAFKLEAGQMLEGSYFEILNAESS